jgi:uncharacterized protein DUF6632
MSNTARLGYLRIALIAVGLIFLFGIYALGKVWPSGWTWGQGHSHYLLMIQGVYATLGIFLLLAAKNPEANRSLIWFTVWSSVVHAVIMAVQALNDPGERGHLLGDVPALVIVAVVLAALTPRGALARR